MNGSQRNDITNDKLITKPANDKFREGWERIFGNKYKSEEDKTATDTLPMFLKPQAS